MPLTPDSVRVLVNAHLVNLFAFLVAAFHVFSHRDHFFTREERKMDERERHRNNRVSSAVQERSTIPEDEREKLFFF